MQLAGPTGAILSSLPLDIFNEPAPPSGKTASAAAPPSKPGAKKGGLEVEAPASPKVMQLIV